MTSLGTKSLVLSLSRPLLAAVFAALAVPVAGQATLLLGTLNINGSVNISTGRIDFTGPFTVSSTSTGDFAPLGTPVQTMGSSQNIDNPPYAVNTVVVTPNFITFFTVPNISFTLMQILGGTQSAAQCLVAPAAGQNCTPNLPNPSPFNLANTTATTSTASFTVLGTEVDSLTSTSVAINGVYTAQFGVPYQVLLATVNGGGTLSTSYSATFTTQVVPEPSTAALLGCGALLFAIAATTRRRFAPGRK